jgi:hypothetical protein
MTTHTPEHDQPDPDEDVTSALTYLALLAEHAGVERIADLGNLPPMPELRRRVARGDFPPYQAA